MASSRGPQTWSGPVPAAHQPAGQQEVRDLHHVVGVEMGQEQPVDGAERHVGLRQPQRRSRPQSKSSRTPPASISVLAPNRCRSTGGPDALPSSTTLSTSAAGESAATGVVVACDSVDAIPWPMMFADRQRATSEAATRISNDLSIVDEPSGI